MLFRSVMIVYIYCLKCIHMYTAGRSLTLLDEGLETLHSFICGTNSVGPLEHPKFVLQGLVCPFGTGPLACSGHDRALGWPDTGRKPL